MQKSSASIWVVTDCQERFGDGMDTSGLFTATIKDILNVLQENGEEQNKKKEKKTK